ncbi:glycosyltransferase family 1 protein [Sphingomonas sp.]|jgi:glycosyltransferase involved in cell wall biosynthesis|uniref:glycosyltransferase family 4 protein n=1 Tax=Sphingomonas sp. TaxID=28214 RepID=UPI002EDA3864
MRIALVSDAWAPQVNGVVRTLTATVSHLRALGHRVETVTPDAFRTVACPSYPEVRLALGAGRVLRARLAAFDPDTIHIATEGPLGWAARSWCIDQELAFTTSFHTRFPDYLAVRTHLPARMFWAPLRRFHAAAARVLVATGTLEDELRGRGLDRLHRWSRGVDLSLFHPDGPRLPALDGVPGPIALHVGRLAPEKNIEAFLSLDTPGTKVVVGHGPARATLQRRFPEAVFLGALHGEALAAAYRSADVFVFPSRTDTFGLVMAEAMACGTPVAALSVAGPLDVIGDPRGGALDDDLGRAIERALQLDRAACAHVGRGFDWAACTRQFLAGLQPVRDRIASRVPA